MGVDLFQVKQGGVQFSRLTTFDDDEFDGDVGRNDGGRVLFTTFAVTNDAGV